MLVLIQRDRRAPGTRTNYPLPASPAYSPLACVAGSRPPQNTVRASSSSGFTLGLASRSQGQEIGRREEREGVFSLRPPRCPGALAAKAAVSVQSQGDWHRPPHAAAALGAPETLLPPSTRRSRAARNCLPLSLVHGGLTTLWGFLT